MKKSVLILFVMALTFSVQAQINTPAPSPSAKIEQTVGLTDVSVSYSRPSMRGRTIFGDLVPLGCFLLYRHSRWWNTG